MLLRTLGSLRLEGSEFTRPKPLLLAAYLALEGPRERRFLAELFWSEARDPRKSLGVALSQLRSGAPGLLEDDSKHVGVWVETDVERFRRSQADNRLEQALTLYRGPFLGTLGLSGLGPELEEWIYATREHLATAARSALIRLGEEEAGRGDWAEAGRRAEEAVHLFGAPPLEADEARRVHLLLVAAESPRARGVLEENEDLGLQDSVDSPNEARARLEELAQRGRLSPPTNLAAPTDSFVGREVELQRVRQLLEDPTVRLVTLLGPPGVGKTRLASEVGRRILGAELFSDGVFVVSLAPLADPRLFPDRIAESLGLKTRRSGATLEELEGRLRRRQLLLMLDNFEHLREAAPAVAALLAACARLKVLVTSRVALRLSGEQELPVPPLRLPAPNDLPSRRPTEPALRLFRERASAIRPDLKWSADGWRAAMAICRQLDGLPLAIELAAARVRLLSLSDLAARLERRLDLVHGGAHDLPARQRSLRQAIAWSYELLTGEQRWLFRQLAVFRGGCSLAEVERFAEHLGRSPDEFAAGLESLLAHSLLERESPHSGPPRFSMLETLREFALEQLTEGGEEQEARRAHAKTQHDLVEMAAPHLTGPDQLKWLERLRRQKHNLRAALEWAEATREIDLGLKLATAAWRTWVVHGPLEEGDEWLERLLAAADDRVAADTRATALNALATLRHEIGDYSRARPLLEQSLAMAREIGDSASIVAILNNLTWVLLNLGELDRAEQLSRESLKLVDTHVDPRAEAVALHNLGWSAFLQGDLDAALELQRRSLDQRRAAGDIRGEAFALTNVALALASQGDGEGAMTPVNQALDRLARLGDDQLMARALNVRALAHKQRGRSTLARRDLDRSVLLWQRVGNRIGLAWALVDRGRIQAQAGRRREAEADLREAAKQCESTGNSWLRSRALAALQQLLETSP